MLRAEGWSISQSRSHLHQERGADDEADEEAD